MRRSPAHLEPSVLESSYEVARRTRGSSPTLRTHRLQCFHTITG
jgi:hypothetical protein